jgi:ribosomal protein S18 acetylase RimI-like enzyme
MSVTLVRLALAVGEGCGAVASAGKVVCVTITVEIATEVTPELVQAFARLIPQLSKSSPAPGAPELAEMLTAGATDVLIARDGHDVLGALTLVVFRIPTGVRAWIEDVVVDDSARGRGVGEALNQFAIDLARAKGAKTVDLTSRPSRESANRLYQRLGFVPRDTNVYRFEL